MAQLFRQVVWVSSLHAEIETLVPKSKLTGGLVNQNFSKPSLIGQSEVKIFVTKIYHYVRGDN